MVKDQPKKRIAAIRRPGTLISVKPTGQHAFVGRQCRIQSLNSVARGFRIFKNYRTREPIRVHHNIYNKIVITESSGIDFG